MQNSQDKDKIHSNKSAKSGSIPSHKDVNLIVVKSNELLNHSFDLDIVTKKSKDGNIKLFLGIDKVTKHEDGDEIASDTIN